MNKEEYFYIPDDPEGTLTHMQCRRCKEWVSLSNMHNGASIWRHHISVCKDNFEERR